MVNFEGQSREQGEGAVNYFAVLLLVASVLAAVVLTGFGGFIAEAVRYRICLVYNDEAECESPADVAFKPTCMAQMSFDKYGRQMEALIFSVGRDYAFLRRTTVDSATGGTKVQIIALKGMSGGVGTGIGVGFNAGKILNIGVDADASATLRLGTGDGWEFTGPNAVQDADTFQEKIREQFAIDAVKENGGLLGSIGGTIYDAFAGPDIPAADIRRHEVEVNYSVSLAFGLGLGPPDKPEYRGRHRRETIKDRIERYDKRGSNGITPNASAWVGIDGNDKIIQEENKKTGEVSYTMLLRGGVGYGEQHVIDGNQGQRSVWGAMTVTKDEHGNLTELTLSQHRIVDGEATVTTTRLPLTDPEERATVLEYLLQPLHLGQLSLGLTWDDLAPTQEPGPDADPFQRLLFEQGRTSRVNYTYYQNDESWGAGVKLGLKLGTAFTLSNSNREVVDAEYLGAPLADGRRIYKDLAECDL